MDHRSFRDQLLFSIGFEVSRNRDLLRRLLKEHITDATREQLAKKVVEAERIGKSYVSRILRLALLAPDIVEAILAGRRTSR